MQETDLVLHTCNHCGPKAACLFAPSEIKKNTSYCLKCIADRRKKRIFPNPVSAASEGFHFNSDYRKKPTASTT